MDYDKSLAILDQFEARYREAFREDSSTHGVRVVPAGEGEARLEVLIAPGPAAEREREGWTERLPDDRFAYSYHDREGAVRVAVVVQERYRALGWGSPEVAAPEAEEPVKPGEFIEAFVAGNTGTAGLNFFLDGTLSCISCWHVMCALQGETTKGPKTPVLLKGYEDVAFLADYRRVYFDNRVHTWDLAIATYLERRMAANVMASCSDGSGPFPYPGPFASEPVLGEVHDVYKVGARSPVCAVAPYDGTVFNGRVDYGGSQPQFKGQLELPHMTDPGDSGALAIYKQSNKILGLHFAVQNVMDAHGGGVRSLANPLFRIGWVFKEWVDGLPSYTST